MLFFLIFAVSAWADVILLRICFLSIIFQISWVWFLCWLFLSANLWFFFSWLPFQHIVCSCNHTLQQTQLLSLLLIVRSITTWPCFLFISPFIPGFPVSRVPLILVEKLMSSSYAFLVSCWVHLGTEKKRKPTCQCWWRTGWGCWRCTSWRPEWAGCHSELDWSATPQPPSGTQK